MREIILVDTENLSLVPTEIEQLNESCELVLFISKYSKGIHPLCFKMIQDKRLSLVYENVEYKNATKNCMDFHIVAYLGAITCTQKENRYYILSKDKGFCEVAKYIQQKAGVEVRVIASLEQVEPLQETKETENLDKKMNQIIEICVLSCDNMQQVYRKFVECLRKDYDLTMIAEFYNEYKEIIRNKIINRLAQDSGNKQEEDDQEKKEEKVVEESLIMPMNVERWARLKTFLNRVKEDARIEALELKRKSLVFKDGSYVSASKCQLGVIKKKNLLKDTQDVEIQFIIPDKNDSTFTHCFISVTPANKNIVNKFIKEYKKQQQAS